MPSASLRERIEVRALERASQSKEYGPAPDMAWGVAADGRENRPSIFRTGRKGPLVVRALRTRIFSFADEELAVAQVSGYLIWPVSDWF